MHCRIVVCLLLADPGFARGADAGSRTVVDSGVERRMRRRSRPGLFDAADLPVAPRYVARLEAAGLEPRVQSRWLNAVSAWIDEGDLETLRGLDFVERVALVSRSVRPEPREQCRASAWRGAADGGIYGPAEDQLTQIQIPSLHALGYTGSGVIVGMIDTGFATSHDTFNDPSGPLDVVAAYDFVDDDPEVGPEVGDDPYQHEHGTLILGTLAANLSGVLVGAAPDASDILCKTEDVTSETPVEEDNYVAGLEFIEMNGGDVATSSLGYIDWYEQSDLDPQTSALIAPSDAFEVITCRAVASTKELSIFSSDGPSADGRVKPEVLAQGESVWSVWPYDDVSLVTASGTSLSTPLVARAVACLVQAEPDRDVATMRDRLKRTASYFGSPVPDPLFAYGYGIVAALDALEIAGTWTDLGGGVAGTLGTPTLTGTGPLVGTDTITLALASARPGGFSVFFVGFSSLGAAFKGGTLWPALDVPFFGLPIDGGGELTLASPWVPDLPGGLELYLQHWIPDPTAVQGLAASNGLLGTVP